MKILNDRDMMFLSGAEIEMEKEISISKTVETKTFKAKIRASKPHYIKKVISHRTALKDAHNTRFSNSMTAFMPTLTPQYPKAHIMLHLSNGSGSVLVRSKDPLILASWLEDMANTLRSDHWLDLWEQLKYTSDNLVYGADPSTLDEEFMDVPEFKHDFIENGSEGVKSEYERR